MPSERALQLRRRRAGLIDPVLPETDSSEEDVPSPPQRSRPAPKPGTSAESIPTTHRGNESDVLLDESQNQTAPQKDLQIEKKSIQNTMFCVHDDSDIEVLNTIPAPKQNKGDQDGSQDDDDSESDKEGQPSSNTTISTTQTHQSKSSTPAEERNSSSSNQDCLKQSVNTKSSVKRKIENLEHSNENKGTQQEKSKSRIEIKVSENKSKCHFSRIDTSRTHATISSDSDDGDSDLGQHTSTLHSSSTTCAGQPQHNTNKVKTSKDLKASTLLNSRLLLKDLRKESESDARWQLEFQRKSWLGSPKDLKRMCDVFNSVTRRQRSRKIPASERSKKPPSSQ